MTELRGTALELEIAQSIGDVVAALVDDRPPRPQLLIVDLDSLSAGALLHLHSVREQGWFGKVIAIGRVSTALRTSLGVHRTVMVGPDKLRPIAMLAGEHTSSTMRMPKLG